MQKWEYWFVSLISSPDLVKFFEEEPEKVKPLGEAGWELVAAAVDMWGNHHLYFKRPKV